MNISIHGAQCTVIAHKYAVRISHPDLEEPFKMVIIESISEGVGEGHRWIAYPEIQLRQTVQNKQEYITSNANPSIESAIKECLRKMAISPAKEIFYKEHFEEDFNRLW